MQSRSRVFLLTGVTGFLGKVLLEELVRRKEELGIQHIGVVIRPMRGLSAEERFHREVIGARCFQQLPAQWMRIVTVLEGNVEEPGLGLSAACDEFMRGVTHVVHAAASVKFNLLGHAGRAREHHGQPQPAGSGAHAAEACPINLCVLNGVRDARSRGGGPIDEMLVALPIPATELYASCLQGSTPDARLLERTGHPNSYTLTKAIAEHMLVEHRGDVPLTIIRPSIITASRQHPFPGWIDSTAGYAAFVLFVGTGHLRALVCRPASETGPRARG